MTITSFISLFPSHLDNSSVNSGKTTDDVEIRSRIETYESQVKLCKEEMQNEIDRLTEHYQQLSNDEQIRARTQLQLRELVCSAESSLRACFSL